MSVPLILVPTDRERRVLGPRLVSHGRVELCGFGLVAAAARTATLLATGHPTRVVLVGIAGCLDDRLAIGSAWQFDRVACHGIGAGTGAAFVPAGTLGWPQWPGDPPTAAAAIGDDLPCGVSGHGPLAPGVLLTVAAAAAEAGDVAARRTLVPDAVAEDMEGFAVAAACRLSGVPVAIVRGISNTAGDRDAARWRVDAALEAAADVAVQVLQASP
ncbi:MAG: futalosine hydrolase [Planctomycetaceae bacterium]